MVPYATGSSLDAGCEVPHSMHLLSFIVSHMPITCFALVFSLTPVVLEAQIYEAGLRNHFPLWKWAQREPCRGMTNEHSDAANRLPYQKQASLSEAGLATLGPDSDCSRPLFALFALFSVFVPLLSCSVSSPDLRMAFPHEILAFRCTECAQAFLKPGAGLQHWRESAACTIGQSR